MSLIKFLPPSPRSRGTPSSIDPSTPPSFPKVKKSKLVFFPWGCLINIFISVLRLPFGEKENLEKCRWSREWSKNSFLFHSVLLSAEEREGEKLVVKFYCIYNRSPNPFQGINQIFSRSSKAATERCLCLENSMEVASKGRTKQDSLEKEIA